jgi:Uncharacterized conserved protein (DUF2190)
MALDGLTKSYLAEGAINPNRIVKVGAADYGVLQAAAVAGKLLGISTEIDAANSERVDVVQEGIADLTLGGTVARGDFLTTDAPGQGVTAAAAAGTNNQVICKALTSGVNGDIIPVLVAPSMLQG